MEDRNTNPLWEEEFWIARVKDIVVKASKLYDGGTPLDVKIAGDLFYGRYDEVPPHIISRIKYKAEFDASLDEYENPETSLQEFIECSNEEEIPGFTNMIRRFYPQYLPKLQTYITFS